MNDELIMHLQKIRAEIRGKLSPNITICKFGDFYCFNWIPGNKEKSCSICAEFFPQIKNEPMPLQCGGSCPYAHYSIIYIVKKITQILNCSPNIIKNSDLHL